MSESEFKILVGGNIQKARISIGMDQAMLGRITGYSKQMISHMESGRREIRLTTLFTIANILKKPIEYFIR